MRAPFIVIEGLDRSGKDTQSELILEYVSSRMKAKLIHFPNRETTTGRLINDYLQKRVKLTDTEIHNLYAVNRREEEVAMRHDLLNGTALISIRYAFSGAAYSKAKDVPELPLEACLGPDRGVIAPDTVLFLTSRVADVSARAGFGDELYETSPFQAKVAASFELVKQESVDSVRWVDIPTGTIEEVFESIKVELDRMLADAASDNLGPIRRLWATPSGDSQQLETDRVILVDEDDRAVGSSTKRDTHVHPGQLHRAFSLLLFNEAGRLLLQQRAASKTTFPHYWSNTVCSHPLDVPDENTEVPIVGVGRALVRRAKYELGLDLGDVELTCPARIRYHARSDSIWSENEVDYIMVGRVEGRVTLTANPDEVSAVRWVDREEMAAMLADRSQLVSPWFRAICEQLILAAWSGTVVRLTESKDLIRIQPDIPASFVPLEVRQHVFVTNVPGSKLAWHRMICPWRSVCSVEDMTASESAELFLTQQDVTRQLKRISGLAGCTILNYSTVAGFSGMQDRMSVHVVARNDDEHESSIYDLVEQSMKAGRE
ncbi:Isopentenyl-diphosphate delta-isomerase, type 1 [Carpediemonas membranifera]|uniref:isopentenyl-diphosphate Delta-isomerase n=1 Tax=Carpediemonas membranifera TaxID=201153 RepID=A0A8J6BAU2_9EUKA|nr:Isopentenyl-diphosphate delta-isomerase, type 1 [Carpediemonas membranifera]|eukprot:KAG9393507.1 Isopentenyl-diphosphate delta-isomerase, type 1 [Carpediemonas membranifera]